MKIIIPAKQLNARDFSSDIVVDNIIDKVQCIQYKVERATEDEITSDSVSIHSSDFSSEINHKINSSLVWEATRVESFYSSGEIEVTTNKNITKINKITPIVTGTKFYGKLTLGAKELTEEWIKDTPANFSTVWDINNQSFSQTLKSPSYKGVSLPLRNSFETTIIPTENGTTIKIKYKILNGSAIYYLKTRTTGMNSNVEVYDGSSYLLKLEAEELSANENSKVIIGEGSNLYEIESNELYQVENTYNGIPMAEHNANEIIRRYKNGIKTSSFSAKVNNLKTQSGYTLEKQVLEPRNEVIPYYINKYNKEVPFAISDNGKDMTFIVSSSEVNYDKVLTQNIECYEKSYFDLELGDFVSVLSNNVPLTPNDSIYKGNKLVISLNKNAFENGQTYGDYSISINGEFYKFENEQVEFEVYGDTTIYAVYFTPVINTNAELYYYGFTITDFGQSNFEGFAIDEISTIDKTKEVSFTATFTIQDKNGTTTTKTMTSSTFYIDNSTGYIKNIIEGESGLYIDCYLSSNNTMSITFYNSNNYKFTAITINSINQGVVLK